MQVIFLGIGGFCLLIFLAPVIGAIVSQDNSPRDKTVANRELMPSAKSNKTEPAKKMKVAANSEKTIGRWAYKGAGSHELEIIMIKNRYFSRYKYEGQPSFNRGLIRKGGPNGKKYEDLESDEGAYYVVTSSGGLTAYDNARFIRTLKKKR